MAKIWQLIGGGGLLAAGAPSHGTTGTMDNPAVHRVSAVSVRGTSQLSAASHEHVVRSRDGLPTVDGAVETGTHVARLCSIHSRILYRLSVRSQHQGMHRMYRSLLITVG